MFARITHSLHPDSALISSCSALLASIPLIPLACHTHNLAAASPRTWQTPRAARGSGKHQQLCCRSVPTHICVGLFLCWPCQNPGCCCSCMPSVAPGACSLTLTLTLPTKHTSPPAALLFSFKERLFPKPLCKREAIKMGLTADIVDGPSKLPTEMRKHH